MLGVRGDGLVELGHEIGAPLAARRRRRPRPSACGCARVSAGCRAGSRWRRPPPRARRRSRSARQRGYQCSPPGSMRAGARATSGRIEARRRARPACTARRARAALRCARASRRARAGSAPCPRSSVEADCAVALRQSLAVVAEQQRHVGVARDGRQPEQLVEPELARRRGEQIGSADDVRDALRRIVDDDCELVGDDAVAAPQHDVAARALEQLVLRALQVVANSTTPSMRTRSAGVRPSARRAARSLVAEIAAGAGVERTVGAVRCRGGATHVGARAEALVEDAALAQRGDARPRRARRGRIAQTGSPSQSRPSQASESRLQLGTAAAARGARSRSSKRSRKRPPACRAQSHAISAVRALPRWRSPVGLGA